MKLTPQTENWIKLLVGSVIFTLVGLGLTYLVGQVSALDCVRASGEQPICRYTVSFMGKYTLKEMAIQDLQSAYVEESCDDDGCTYKVVLITSFGPQAFTDSSDSDQSGKQVIADRVNAFVQSTGADEIHVTDGGGFWLIFPLIFLAAGLWMGGQLVVDLIRYLIALRKDDFPS